MCILFSYIAKRLTTNQFKLILLNNRDEYHFRPSKPASLVTEHSIYGMDLTPGKEGGTWLGLSKRAAGKLGVLLNLNVADGEDSAAKAGRGFLVPNFINSEHESSMYLESVVKEMNTYNPFNLLLYERDIGEDVWRTTLFDSLNCRIDKPDDEFVSISNHVYDVPYPKTVTGQSIFKSIVSEYNKVHLKNDLLDKLFELAKYDANLKYSNEMNRKQLLEMERKQVFIDLPGYGTRTHTIILVNDKNEVTYLEKTMKFPIDASNPEWLENKFEFKLE